MSRFCAIVEYLKRAAEGHVNDIEDKDWTICECRYKLFHPEPYYLTLHIEKKLLEPSVLSVATKSVNNTTLDYQLLSVS
jgi:hypothetical protein